MGVTWVGPKNAGRRASLRRSASPRVVPGAPLSAGFPSQRTPGRVGVFALADLPAIDKRRRYLAALDRIVARIRQT